MTLKEVEASDDHLVLQIPSAHEHLEALVERVAAFLTDALDDTELVYNIQLLVSEAATNAVEHGNRDDAELSVKVTLEVAPDEVHVAVEDEGEGFARADVADPTADENLLKSGGRGLFLIEALADKVAYEDEGRTIRMVFIRAR